ncbi:43kDa postsynaptic protein [Parasponia andersonii]|uniref:RING-type E3 ubiquitin transferase n=1 Tax=Parasponia andersonii TaxID=3476 RepID=A0A2P5AQX6_PARAD|nr:43kDa postsynaptic protein [Parasponia andersonii]
MPVLAETCSTMAEHMKLRRPRSQFGQLISETDPNPHEIPSIIQSTRCKSTISSLLLSTFSSNNSNNAPNEAMPINIHNPKKKNNFSSSTLRGLGCTAGSSQQVSVPAVIRSSADWQEKKVRKKKQKKNSSRNSSSNGNNSKESGKDRSALHQGLVDGSNSASCVDFQDVWCGPGIGFSADAAASVDCVVARRNATGRGKIDGDKMTCHRDRDRERSCLARRTVTPEPPSFFDTEPDFLSERPGSEVFGARYFHHVRHPSPEGLAEIMMLHSGLLMGGRVDIHDRFRDLRLDVDNMSYEELLDLGERIGYVNTGLKEDEIGRCLRKIKLSISNEWSRLSTQADRKCSICQEEFEADDDLGKLNCGHGFHTACIRHWLSHKNTCPVCKAEAVARS